MKFAVDHDYHIHSYLSLCSDDPLQTTENILKYAKENNLKKICLTDHHWDETVPGASGWYQRQDFNHILAAKPLPQDSNVEFKFGCETDLDKFMTVGMRRDHYDRFDFVIIPTTHLHMLGFTISEEDAESLERRAQLWVSRFDGLLDMDLPFEKIGIAHLNCSLMAMHRKNWEDHIDVLNMIPDDDLHSVFNKASKKGAGIELNFALNKYTKEQQTDIKRIYDIAKEEGCKFYFGSDAHHPKDFIGIKENFENIVDWLGLTEDDKFIL